ncbi:MAG: N-acetyl-gamma-glutamyl-phosphate reductase [Desulfovibrio sp.]
MSTIPVGLVGVSGYGGLELARLLLAHPTFELVQATSRAEAGKTLAQFCPHFTGTKLADLTISAPDVDALAKECKLVFLAVPHKTAMEISHQLLKRGVKVVDFSADFRINDKEIYEEWYGCEHTRTELLPQAVYGLPELNADAIKKADLIANPGCYPTSSILGLTPALSHKLIETENIVIDAKSGTSGAGRGAKVGTLFCEVHDSFKAYGLGSHRHTPEIEQEISKIAEKDITVSFNTHLIPIDRGILATIYTKLTGDHTQDEIQQMYEDFYAEHPWVRVLPKGTLPETRWVKGTLFCDIGIVVDPRTNRLLIVSAIDNLCRGAAGQALANANLMYDQPLEAGLPVAPLIP